MGNRGCHTKPEHVGVRLAESEHRRLRHLHQQAGGGQPHQPAAVPAQRGPEHHPHTASQREAERHCADQPHLQQPLQVAVVDVVDGGVEQVGAPDQLEQRRPGRVPVPADRLICPQLRRYLPRPHAPVGDVTAHRVREPEGDRLHPRRLGDHSGDTHQVHPDSASYHHTDQPGHRADPVAGYHPQRADQRGEKGRTRLGQHQGDSGRRKPQQQHRASCLPVHRPAERQRHRAQQAGQVRVGVDALKPAVEPPRRVTAERHDKACRERRGEDHVHDGEVTGDAGAVGPPAQDEAMHQGDEQDHRGGLLKGVRRRHRPHAAQGGEASGKPQPADQELRRGARPSVRAGSAGDEGPGHEKTERDVPGVEAGGGQLRHVRRRGDQQADSDREQSAPPVQASGDEQQHGEGHQRVTGGRVHHCDGGGGGDS